MYAASPGLHGVEHPIYDIWLTDCKAPDATVVSVQTDPAKPAPSPPAQKRAPPRQAQRPPPQFQQQPQDQPPPPQQRQQSLFPPFGR
jgi:hypothetical protein